MRLVFAVLAVLYAASASASPDLLRHSARLLNADGQPLNGVFTVSVGLFRHSSGGEALHRVQQSLTVSDGAFSIELAGLSPDTVHQAQ